VRIKFLLLCLFGVFVLLSAQHSYAAIYKYLDKDGLICFANDLQSIPEQYRGSAKIVSGEEDPVIRPTTQYHQTTGQSAGRREQDQGTAHGKSAVLQNEAGFFNSRMLLTSIVIVSAVFAFVVLGILETDHRKTVAILRVTLLWAVSLYLLIAHAGDAVRMIRAVGGTIEDAKHHSEEKGKNAAKAVKAFNTLVEQAGQAPSSDSAEPEKKE